MILIPLLSLSLPLSEVPFALTLGTFSNSAARIISFKAHINWRLVAWFVPFSLPAVAIGALAIRYVNPLYLQFIVAVLLIMNIRILFSKNNNKEQSQPMRKWKIAVVGFAGGLVSGITGAIGLLFNRFYLSNNLNKEEIIATRAANEIILHAIKLIVYLLLGLYSAAALVYGAVIALAAIVAAPTIKYILPYISENLFKRLGYFAMVVSGFYLLWNTGLQIVAKDQIILSTNTVDNKEETTLHWRKSAFILEYAIGDGLEVERPITESELPENLKLKYDSLKQSYQQIYLEKVYSFNAEPNYEFYCYKQQELTKLEFE